MQPQWNRNFGPPWGSAADWVNPAPRPAPSVGSWFDAPNVSRTVAWGGVAILGLAGIWLTFRKDGAAVARKVFVSFDYDQDAKYKHMLAAWDANAGFDFSWVDQSVTVPINSTQAGPIRVGITKKMQEADLVLVIVGEHTHRSDWVIWEIAKAKELGLGLVGVKLAKSNVSPQGLLGSGASWATSFTRDSIVTAINNCLPARSSIW